MTNFDIVPNRRNTNSYKWTLYPTDVLPMWVADMDFPAPEPILNSLRRMLDHGVLGYENPSRVLKETVAARMNHLYGWKVKPEAVIAVTGIVSGFTVAARAFCSKRRGVAIQTPVYNVFHYVKDNVGIPQIDIPFVKQIRGNILYYEMDWDVFEKQVRKAGIFLLCNPHNPLGMIFSRQDLTRMAEICIRNNVLIVSDEIHSELIWDDNIFTPIAKLSREIADHTITLVSPSKTFNIPGLFCGFAIIPNKEIRKQYVDEVNHATLHVANMGLQAARIAFSGQCDGWLKRVRHYLTGNRDFLVEYVTDYMPNVRTTIPDATYLGWLDFTRAGIKGSPFKFFLKKAKVAFSDGKTFGMDGIGHIRLNFGTSRKLLEQGLERMRKALRSI